MFGLAPSIVAFMPLSLLRIQSLRKFVLNPAWISQKIYNPLMLLWNLVKLRLFIFLSDLTTFGVDPGLETHDGRGVDHFRVLWNWKQLSDHHGRNGGFTSFVEYGHKIIWIFNRIVWYLCQVFDRSPLPTFGRKYWIGFIKSGAIVICSGQITRNSLSQPWKVI